MRNNRIHNILVEDQTPERLDEVLWRFANTVSDNQWAKSDKREVQFVRSVTERTIDRIVLPKLEGIRDKKQVLPESTIDTYVQFKAFKTFQPGNNPYDRTDYEIGTTVTQTIGSDDISDYLLERIWEENKEFGGRKVYSRKRIAKMVLEREQGDFYDIYNGKVEAYSTSLKYVFDSDDVLEAGYHSVADQPLSEPIHIHGKKKPVDRKPYGLSVLTDAEIAHDTEHVDVLIKDFLGQDTLSTLLKIDGQSEQEHIRKVLTALSMLSSGLFKIL